MVCPLMDEKFPAIVFCADVLKTKRTKSVSIIRYL
jgi:hypothetical protein